jgi:hypothetical protein
VFKHYEKLVNSFIWILKYYEKIFLSRIFFI